LFSVVNFKTSVTSDSHISAYTQVNWETSSECCIIIMTHFTCSYLCNVTEFVSASVTQHFCSVICVLDLRHVNDDSNTN